MGKKKIGFEWNETLRQLPRVMSEIEEKNGLGRSSKYTIKMLILKYENAKKQQEDLKINTPLTNTVQYKLLEQNIHIYNGIIKDLREL
jgi:transposase